MPISSEGIILKQMPQKNFTEKILRTQQKIIKLIRKIGIIIKKELYQKNHRQQNRSDLPNFRYPNNHSKNINVLDMFKETRENYKYE